MHGEILQLVGNELGVRPFEIMELDDVRDEESAKPAVGTDAAGSSQDFGTFRWQLFNQATSGDRHTEEAPRFNWRLRTWRNARSESAMRSKADA